MYRTPLHASQPPSTEPRLSVLRAEDRHLFLLGKTAGIALIKEWAEHSDPGITAEGYVDLRSDGFINGLAERVSAHKMRLALEIV